MKAGSPNSDRPISSDRGANQSSEHASSGGLPPEALRELETTPAMSEPWPPRQALRSGEKPAPISSSLAYGSSQTWLADAHRSPTGLSGSQFPGASSHWDDSLLGSFLTQLDVPQPSTVSEQFAPNDMMPEFISWMFPPVNLAAYPEQTYPPGERNLEDRRPVSSTGIQESNRLAVDEMHPASTGSTGFDAESHLDLPWAA